MSNRCTRCGGDTLNKVELNKSLLINTVLDSIPDIFPLKITTCDKCGYVQGPYIPSGPQHDGYFTYKNVSDNVYPPHYHKSGWHFEYVTLGSFDYYQRPVGSTDIPICTNIKAGQLYFSQANIEHGFIFKERTGLISIVNKGRPTDDFTVVSGDFYGFIPITKI